MTHLDTGQLSNQKWLMFAPGHDNLDHRVNRTISAIEANGHDLTVYYEADRLVSGGAVSGVKITELPRISKAYFKQVINEIKAHKTNQDHLVIYVHDSGFIGLIICLMASFLKRKDDQIIFDYHDLLEWELYYQSSRVTRWKPIKKILVTLVRLFFKLVLSWVIRLDMLIGISSGQVNLLRDRFGLEARNIQIAPNTRKKLVGSFERRGPTAILWVGNVSKGRRFEDTYALQAMLKGDRFDLIVKIAVVGKRLNAAADDVVNDALVTELGGFKADTDIAQLTEHLQTVGVFFGWDDNYKTGINTISSVNKIYSYINTQTPFLLPDNQTNMIETLKIPDVFIFRTPEDMADRFRWIAENYAQAQILVKNLKAQAVWDADVVATLEEAFAV